MGRAPHAHPDAGRTRSPALVSVQYTPQLRSFCQSQSGADATACSPRLGAVHHEETLYFPLGRSGHTSRPSSDTSTRKSCGPSVWRRARESEARKRRK